MRWRGVIGVTSSRTLCLRNGLQVEIPDDVAQHDMGTRRALILKP
jgi:hypothetical protein